MSELARRIISNINALIDSGVHGNQAALARLVEMDSGQFNKILKGKQKFPLWLAEKIAEKTGKSVDDFLQLPPAEVGTSTLRLEAVSLLLALSDNQVQSALDFLTTLRSHAEKAAPEKPKKGTAG